MTPTGQNIRAGLLAICGGIFLYIAAEQAVFGSGWYLEFLDPDSLAGRMELMVEAETARPRSPVPDVAVVGNSVFAEGFSAKTANAAAGGSIRFWNLAIPASTPRCWYYLLREVDPDARRYRAIVFQADEFSDEDGPFPMADEIADAHILSPLLMPLDAWDFAFSFENPRLRFEALRGALLKGYIFKQDVQAFLEAQAARLEKVAQARQGLAGWLYDYQGHPESLAGMTVDWKRRTLVLPPGVPAEIQEMVRRIVLRKRAPATGEQAAYRKLWFGRILERYRSSATRIIFVRPPRGPAVNPAFDAPGEPSTIRGFAVRPGVRLLPPESFTSLELPQYFWDAYHMNSEGRVRFSGMLAGAVAPLAGRS